LGETFDIHGGGMDLMFPHHEAEIAQSKAANGHDSANYWVHNNMITLNGQKMGKSLGNAISLDEFFAGTHPLLDQPYSPMTIRFFMLQAHYRSTLDFSNEALQAAEKGLKRLFAAVKTLFSIEASAQSTVTERVVELHKNCFEAMDDDLNSPIAIAHLFDGVKMINSIKDGKEQISKADLDILRKLYYVFIFEIFGLYMEEKAEAGNSETLSNVVDLLLNLRMEAKANKDWATSDKIRNELTKLGFEIKDTKDGFSWELKK